MFIKQPNSSIALERLSDVLRYLGDRFEVCVKSRHRSLTVLYVSSYVITTNGIRGSKGATGLLDLVRKAVNLSPQGFVCVVRTSAPSVFSGNLSKRQREAVDSLRSSCYVRCYGKGEFVNHAKFVIGYHFCFSEGVFYYGKYYGSTNLTEPGLATSLWGLGNYEEFNFSRLRMDLVQNLRRARGQWYYIYEIYSTVNSRYRLYTDERYLKNYFEDHVKYFRDLLSKIKRVVEGTTRAQLFQAYAKSLALNIHILAFVDDLPGKKLTSEILSEVERIGVRPPDPLEVEVLLTESDEVADKLAELLNLREDKLREEIVRYLNASEKLLNLLKQTYRVDRVRQYYDEIEEGYYRFLMDNGRTHMKMLEEVYRMIPKY
jgi:hypothetical protein